MTLKALIFDVDGTLADTEEAHRCAFNEAFREHGTGWQWSQAEYAELLRTTGGKERIGAYIASVKRPPDDERRLRERIGAIHATKTQAYARMVRSGAVALRAGVKELINQAQSRGLVLAIATTTTLDNIDALLTTTLGADALARFRVIGAGDQVSRKKPAPDIYEFVLAQLALPAAHCIALEDSANGLAAAKAAGLFTVVTPSYWTQHEDFTTADWVLPSFTLVEQPVLRDVSAMVDDTGRFLGALERRFNASVEGDVSVSNQGGD